MLLLSQEIQRLKEQYEKMIAAVRPLQRLKTNESAAGTKFCDSQSCEI